MSELVADRNRLVRYGLLPHEAAEPAPSADPLLRYFRQKFLYYLLIGGLFFLLWAICSLLQHFGVV